LFGPLLAGLFRRKFDWLQLAVTSYCNASCAYCIGLETRFTDIAKLGGDKPALAFLIAQSFNIVWTLILAFLLFGGLLFPAPVF